MKSIAIIILTLLAFTANSQSLKEALYGGKLKADTGAVLRKGDNQKIQENMAQKVVADSINKITDSFLPPFVLRFKKEVI